MKKIAPPTASTMEVIQFVKTAEIDPLLFEKSYYVLAEDKVSKPYALMRAAMEAIGHYAIARMSMHNREHVVVIRPTQNGFVLHTMYYASELHQGNKTAAPKTSATAKELDLAKMLVSQLAAPFKLADFHDTYKENVERMIEQRRKGQKISAVKRPRQAPVISLTEALKRSLKSTAVTQSSSSKKKSGRKNRAA
jgi:DNA end-binding protein Ku